MSLIRTVRDRSKTKISLAQAPKGTRTKLREIDGPITLGEDKVYAWFLLTPIQTSFRTLEDLDSLYARLEVAYTGLAGRDLRLRMTSRPHPGARWAYGWLRRSWTDQHPYARTTPVNTAAREKYAMLVQKRLRQLNMLDTEVYLGVEIGAASDLKKLIPLPTKHKERRRLRRSFQERFDTAVEIVQGSGLGTLVKPGVLPWLQHRSIGLHIPEPDYMTDETTILSRDITQFEDGVHVEPPAPLGSTITLTARPTRNGAIAGGLPQVPLSSLQDGRRIMLDVDGTSTPVTIGRVPIDAETGHVKVAWSARDGRGDIATFPDDATVTLAPAQQYVAVLSIGRVEAQHTHVRHAPWLGVLHRLGFPVEVSAHIRVLAGHDAKRRAEDLLKHIADQRSQRDNFGDGLSPEDDRIASQIRTLLDRVSTGTEQETVEFEGVYRIAVGGATENIALKRARMVIDLYKNSNNIEVKQSREGQFGLYTEFDLGSSRLTDAYAEFMFGGMFVRALPQMSSRLGDGVGDYLGYTIGDRLGPVMHDSHRAIYASEISGVTPVVGTLGCGKSMFIGARVMDMVKNEIPTTLWDPTGAMARLAYHPDIADRAVHLDLLDAPPGILCPFALIPDPHRDDYETEEDWNRDIELAVTRRRGLAITTAKKLLDISTRDNPATTRVLRRAASTLRATQGTSMTDLLTALSKTKVTDEISEADAQWARTISGALKDTRNMPYAKLIFGSGRMAHSKVGSDLRDALLVVITMQGLPLPRRGTPESAMTEEQWIARPLYSLGAYLTARRLYDGAMSSPKGMVFDEAHRLGEWGEDGQEMFTTLERDSRKRRCRVWVATHSAGDILTGSDGENLTVEGFVGRTEGGEKQGDALRSVLRVPDNPGYRALIGSLSAPVGGEQPDYRDFVARFADGSIDVFRHEILDPLLKAALDPEDDLFLPYLPSHMRRKRHAAAQITSNASSNGSSS